MAQTIALYLFWISAAGLAFTYAGYPAVVILLAKCFRREVSRAPFAGPITVLISVFNDADRLVRKLKNLSQIRGAENIQAVHVGSDGSTDGIAEKLAPIKNPRTILHQFPQRRGKSSVLNDLMTQAETGIVVMMDVRQFLDDDALINLLAPFADASVGVVSGHLVFRRSSEPESATSGVNSYWNYETAIRRAESTIASVPGASGALYAIRRNLLHPIPPETILDDVAIPMQATELGARCLFEASAVCYDSLAESLDSEQIRKRRTIAGVIQLALLYPRWLVPWRNPIWFQFMSHKILRLFSPFFLFVLLIGSAVLSRHAAFAAVLAIQLLAYLAAACGWACSRVGIGIKAVYIPFVFVMLNISILNAWCDAIRGRYVAAWKRT